MILTVLKYYAKFVSKAGVAALFQNGRSSLSEYASLKTEISDKDPVFPGIADYIFGNSFDAVKKRVEQLQTNYLFVEVGDTESTRNKGSLLDSTRMAITVARKISSSTDFVELAIYSQQTMDLLSKIRAHMLFDQGTQPWLKELGDSSNIVPFDVPEFSSYGWTLMFDREGADICDISSLAKSFKNVNE
jgi:hypothetical protein